MPHDEHRPPSTVAVGALLDEQHGVITRAQALAAGCTVSLVDRHLRRGVWHRVLPSVYADATRPASPLAPFAAAALWAGPVGALSHGSAAALWRLLAPAGPPEVLVPLGRAAAPGVIVRRTRAALDRGDVDVVAGLRVTTPARTVIDIAATLDDGALARVIERGRAAGILRRGDLLDRLDRVGARGRAGVGRLRRVVEAIGPGPRSRARLEVEVVAALRALGPPAPEGPVGMLVWPEVGLVVECDGRDPAERARQRFADRDRRAKLVAGGRRLAVVTWDDVARLPALAGVLVGGRASRARDCAS